MVNLIFKLGKTKQKGQTPVEIVLEKNGQVYKQKVQKADNVLEGLDKLLKKYKISITDLKSVKTVDNFSQISYTSCRIVKSIEKALNFGLIFKSN